MNTSPDVYTKKIRSFLVLLFGCIVASSFTCQRGGAPDAFIGHWKGTAAATGIKLDVTDSILFMRRPDSCYGRYRYRFLPQSDHNNFFEAVSVGDKHPMTFIFKVAELTRDRLSFYAAGGRADADAIWEMLDGTPHKVITYTFIRQDKSLLK